MSLNERLSELPIAEPGAARSELIKRRCHARLARHAHRTAITGRPLGGERLTPVWQSLLAVVGLVYLAQVIRFALSIYGLA
jgi:hypothetical protein